MSLSYNYYWPYAENETVVHYDYFTCLGRTLHLVDGNSFYFGNVEKSTNPTDNSISMIYYFCSNFPHTHTDVPSCSRLVLCYPAGSSDIRLP